MPVRSINFVQEKPPRRGWRGGKSPVESTEEYQDVLMMLGAGLKPQEYLELFYPPEHRVHRESKNPATAAHHMLTKKIKDMKLSYDCYVRNGKVYIVGRGVDYA